MEKLSIQHLNILKEYSRKANYEEYNSNPVTCFMWNHYYEIELELHENYVLVLVKYPNNIAWLMPLCEEKYLLDALNHMKDYSNEHHFDFVIHGVTRKFKDLCEQHQFNFIYTFNEDAQDYIYDISMHKSLVGKKMQKRRNHYNAFMKDYEGSFGYRSLEKDDEEMVLSFMDEWIKTSEYQEDIEIEKEGIKTLFTYFDELELHGGCLFINDELKGFSIYSELSENMIQMHVEKTDKSIRGCSVVLLKYTLLDCDSKYLYMNREDDMGLDHLRKAKRDLQPISLTNKYTASYGESRIIKANDSYLEKIKELWLNSFDDEDEISTKFYFDHLYDANHCYLLIHNDEIISMAQVRFMDLMKDNKIVHVPLLFGVCTSSKYQKCGYMRKIVEYVLNEYTYDFMLVQAYNWELYRSFGFSEAYTIECHHYQSNGIYEGVECYDANHLLGIYNDFIKDKDGYRIRDIHYYKNYFIPYKSLYYEIYANEDAYIVVDKEHTLVHECCFRNLESLNKLLNKFDSIQVLCNLNTTNETRNVLMAKGKFNRNHQLFISEIM